MFHLYWGPDATRQSPDMADVLLHETAVSWFRNVIRKSKPEVLRWEGNQAQWVQRARKAIDVINRWLFLQPRWPCYVKAPAPFLPSSPPPHPAEFFLLCHTPSPRETERLCEKWTPGSMTCLASADSFRLASMM